MLFTFGAVIGAITAYFTYRKAVENAQELGFLYPKTPEEKKKAGEYKAAHKTSYKWILLYSGIGYIIYFILSRLFPTAFFDIFVPILIGWLVVFFTSISIAGRLSDKKVRAEFLKKHRST